jgi:hypothetical protein
VTPAARLSEIRDLVEQLRQEGGQPRVHPNGFIQLDLIPVTDWDQSKQRGHSGAMRRLHIWNPPRFPLPHQETTNEIHDHVFDMRSEVVIGDLVQDLYGFIFGQRFAKPPTHELYRAVYDKTSSSRLEAMGVRGYLRLAQSFAIRAGESYTQPAFTLHNSDAGRGCVVTVMEKEQVHEGDATIVCEIGNPPDNTFDRAKAADQDYLWGAIYAALKG